MYVNQMKFVVRILVEEENVFKNFGRVMVIGKKFFEDISLRFEWIYFSDCDDGSDEEQRYCRMDKKKNFLKKIFFFFDL